MKLLKNERKIDGFKVVGCAVDKILLTTDLGVEIVYRSAHARVRDNCSRFM